MLPLRIITKPLCKCHNVMVKRDVRLTKRYSYPMLLNPMLPSMCFSWRSLWLGRVKIILGLLLSQYSTCHANSDDVIQPKPFHDTSRIHIPGGFKQHDGKMDYPCNISLWHVTGICLKTCNIDYQVSIHHVKHPTDTDFLLWYIMVCISIYFIATESCIISWL